MYQSQNLQLGHTRPTVTHVDAAQYFLPVQSQVQSWRTADGLGLVSRHGCWWEYASTPIRVPLRLGRGRRLHRGREVAGELLTVMDGKRA